MLIKSLMLYSLPYVAGVASSMLAANQLAFGPIAPLLNTSVKQGALQDQIVNRSLKGDRLPLLHAESDEKSKIHFEAPTQIAPTPVVSDGCWRRSPSSVGFPLKDFDGRCFAEADGGANRQLS